MSKMRWQMYTMVAILAPIAVVGALGYFVWFGLKLGYCTTNDIMEARSENW